MESLSSNTKWSVFPRATICSDKSDPNIHWADEWVESNNDDPRLICALSRWKILIMKLLGTRNACGSPNISGWQMGIE